MARLSTSWAILALAGAGTLAGCASSSKQQTFDSPQAAADALVSAVSPRDDQSLRQILGPGSEDLINSGDEVADDNAMRTFASMYEQQHAIVPDSGDERTLLVGDTQWPFPIPLVESSGAWRFDTPAGRQELLDRRVGANELNAIEVCLAYVDAQYEYAMRDPDQDGIRDYAQKFVSDPGQRNGLYWDAAPGEAPSPLGALAAEASEAGYSRNPSGAPRPFHGYYYTILMAQGPHASDGGRAYVIDGQMIGGFALIARPATYGNSGVMTFIVNQDGIVYQRDLGSQTEHAASRITRYDPDASWTRANDAAYVGPED